jgi:hypothetical protein
MKGLWLGAIGVAAVALALGGITWARPAGGGGGGGGAKAPVTPATPTPPANDCDLADVQKMPWCKQCNKLVEKEELDGPKHKTCSTPVTSVSVCVKTYYSCETCGKTSKSAGTCATDKKAMTKQVSLSRLIWRCPTCHGKAEAPGKCANATCKGKTLVQSCELSGALPHVRTWPQ